MPSLVGVAFEATQIDAELSRAGAVPVSLILDEESPFRPRKVGMLHPPAPGNAMSYLGFGQPRKCEQQAKVGLRSRANSVTEQSQRLSESMPAGTTLSVLGEFVPLTADGRTVIALKDRVTECDTVRQTQQGCRGEEHDRRPLNRQRKKLTTRAAQEPSKNRRDRPGSVMRQHDRGSGRSKPWGCGHVELAVSFTSRHGKPEQPRGRGVRKPGAVGLL
jgi:hypothetical protein